MYNFILQTIVMLSLGIVIYLFARAVPRVSEEVDDKTESKFDKLIASLPLEKIDAAVVSFLEKQLRKIKLLLMKLDNNLTKHLHKIKKANDKNGNGEKVGLFQTVNEENSEKETAPSGVEKEE